MSRKLHEDKAEYTTGAEEQTIKDSQDPRKYFAMIPNMVDDSDLDPYERTLYLHYVRVGHCHERTETTAAKTHMSVGQVCEKRKTLADKGWITLETNSYGVKAVELVDRWAENMLHYRPSQDSHSESDSPHESQDSHSETKNNHIKNNNNDNNAPEPYVNWQSELQASCFGIDPQTFRDILDAWKEKYDPRRHLEAMRQMKAGHQMSARIYLKAYLNFNPDYVPPAASPPPRASSISRKPTFQRYHEPTAEEKEQFRRELAQRQAEWSKG